MHACIVLLVVTGDSSTSVEIFEYTVVTRTGNKKGAGTDAKVYVTLLGANQPSEALLLENDIRNFQRGREDSFKLYLDQNLGEIRNIVIEQDDSGDGA